MAVHESNTEIQICKIVIPKIQSMEFCELPMLIARSQDLDLQISVIHNLITHIRIIIHVYEFPQHIRMFENIEAIWAEIRQGVPNS